MPDSRSRRPRWAVAAGLFAIAFGMVTVGVGGRTLFGGPAVAAAAGDIVPFVLWFNFGAGFAYIVAGIGLLAWRAWAATLAAAIALSTIAVFAAFGVHVLLGGAYEARTVGAMAVRTLLWTGIAAAAWNAFGGFGRRRS